MKTRRTAFFLFLLAAALCGPSQALVLAGGRGNTTPPPGESGLLTGWNNVGTVRGRYQSSGVWIDSSSRAGVVFLDDDWFITTYHAWWYDNPTGVVVGTTGYTVDIGSMVRLTNDTSITTNALPNTDLAMFRVTQKPNLAPLNITTLPPGGLGGSFNKKSVVMISSGHPRVDAMSYWKQGETNWVAGTEADHDYYGYKFWPNRSQCILRWGVNEIDILSTNLTVNSHFNMPSPFGSAWTFRTTFNDNGNSNECQVALLDSGGGVFYKNGDYWELTGMILTMVQPDGSQPQAVNGIAYGGVSYAADLTFYRDQIMNILRPDGWADLKVKDPEQQAVLTASRGENVSLPITTRNQGTAPAEEFYTALYLVPVWNVAGNYSIARTRIPGLEAGQETADDYTFTAPSDPGTYLLVAKADNDEQIHESYENNNQSGWLARILQVQTGFTFTNTGGRLTITGYTGDDSSEVIPGSINGVPVTRISEEAFSGWGNLEQIVIPSGITNIGAGAFSDCTNLVSITFEGDAPGSGSDLLPDGSGATVYYRLGTSGWSDSWGGLSTKAFLYLPKWSVFEGRLQNRFLGSNAAGLPAMAKLTQNSLIAVRNDYPIGFIAAWSKTDLATSNIPVSIELYSGSRRTDKKGNTVAAKDLTALHLNAGGAGGSVLLGTATWNGRYTPLGIIQKLSLNLTGRAISRSTGKESYGTETLRYNQTISDALSTSVSTAHAEYILRLYLAGKTKRDPAEINISLPIP